MKRADKVSNGKFMFNSLSPFSHCPPPPAPASDSNFKVILRKASVFLVWMFWLKQPVFKAYLLKVTKRIPRGLREVGKMAGLAAGGTEARTQ